MRSNQNQRPKLDIPLIIRDGEWNKPLSDCNKLELEVIARHCSDVGALIHAKIIRAMSARKFPDGT